MDKTELIYQIISNPNYYFLSRPRRFGKSLLVSTLQHLYLGHRQYFENLWFGKHVNWEWKEWPILIMDFNSISSSNPETLMYGLQSCLIENAKKYQIVLEKIYPKEQFKELIIKVSEKTSSKVVILMDEYDKPIIDHIPDDIDIAKANRKKMKEFFGVLKDNEAGALIELLFITGVSKFSQVSIFSELNNLTDLTMDTRFATLLGYTGDEIKRYFHPWIQNWALDQGVDESVIYQNLKDHYDGFRFSKSNEKVYNPISILNALFNLNYENYWFETATPTFLINLLVSTNFSLAKIETVRLNKNDFSSFEPDNLNPSALLFQTGYITIADVKTIGNITEYQFEFPNIEVRQSFLRLLMIKYGRLSFNDNLASHSKIYQDFIHKRFAMAIQSIQDIFALIPEFENQSNDWFHQFFYMLIRSACPFTRTVNIDNKMVIMIESETSIIFTAFSCYHSATELITCLCQEKNINQLKYIAKDIFIIGINFDTKERVISDWTYDQLSLTADEVSEEKKALIYNKKVYLSSSYEDLKEYRAKVYSTLRHMRMDVISMEDYNASSLPPLSKCLSDVTSCDIYIAIIAWKYGPIPKGYDRSFTELEYLQAKQSGKQILIFLLNETALWPKIYIDKNQDMIETFRKTLENNHIVNYFSDESELEKKIILGLGLDYNRLI